METAPFRLGVLAGRYAHKKAAKISERDLTGCLVPVLRDRSFFDAVKLLLIAWLMRMSGIGDETFSLRAGKEESVSLSCIFDDVDEVVLTASGGLVVDDLAFFV
ncbi:hypothetical protein [Silicimonas sp. MF1-12-2]|uniref:hypothetical protein n=1 Tax=Silicimonas sp. MF1-12-2 TaxID=3384793 RepID=UPI0039B6C5A1